MAAGKFSGGGLGFGVTFYLEDLFSNVADKIQAKFQQLDSSVSRVADRIQESFGKVATGIGLIMSGIALLNPIIRAINIAAGFENYEAQLVTLLKTREAAVTALANIKKDAAANPVFGTAQMMQANVALISQDFAPERARALTNALANALAAMGKGNEELSRMGINLQQIAATGKATSQDMKQFAFAGINMYKLISDVTGKTQAQLAEMPITLDMIEKALLASAQEGGRYAGAIERAARTTSGAMAEAGDNIEFMFEKIGRALKPISSFFLSTFNKFMGVLQRFLDTTLGRVVIIVVSATVAFIALGVVIAGLKILFVALTPAIWSALAPLMAVVALLIPYVVLFLALRYAWNQFNGVMEGTVKIRGGFFGFILRLGGLLQGLWAIIKTMNDNGFTLTEKMAQALEKLGILQLVVNLGTWLVRIRAFLQGVWSGIKTGFEAVKSVVISIWDALSPAADKLGVINASFLKNTSSLEKWKAAGKVFGYVIIGVLTLITLGLVALAVASLVAFAPTLIIIAAVIAAIYLLYKAVEYIVAGFQWMGRKIAEAWDWVKNKIYGFWTWIKGLPSAMYNAGVNMVQRLMDGIASVWDKFTTWLSEKVKAIPIIGDVVQFFQDSSVDNVVKEKITAAIEAAPAEKRQEMIAQAKAAGYPVSQEVMDKYGGPGGTPAVNVLMPVYLDGQKLYEHQVAIDSLNMQRE